MAIRDLMNNYFYGKQGKADMTVADLPANRRQLFGTVLRVRWSQMIGVNLLYLIIWIPAIIWTFLNVVTLYSMLTVETGIDMDGVYNDCGMMIYNRETQDTHAGGSGCGCSAAVVASYLLPKLARGELKRVLFLGTGAMMSPQSIQQGQYIPAVAHLVYLAAKEDA